MLAMAKERKKKDEPKAPRKPNRSGVPFYVYVDPAIDEAMRLYIESTEPRVSKTAAAESAFKAFLREKGFWPLKADQEGGKQ